MLLALILRFAVIASCFVFSKGLPSGEISVEDFKNLVVIPDIHGDSKSFLRSIWLALLDIEGADIAGEFDEFASIVLGVAKSEAARRLKLSKSDKAGDMSPQDAPIAASSSSGGKKSFPLSKSPKDTLVIQLGDLADRGPDTLLCFWILDVLESVIGWKVYKLYGNHELMSHLTPENQYVHVLDYKKFDAHFGAPNSRAIQFGLDGQLWQSITSDGLLMVRVGGRDMLSEGDDVSDDFYGNHHHRSFGKSSVPSINSISTLFVHGGVDIEWVNGMKSAHRNVVDETIIDDLNRVTKCLLTRLCTDAGSLYSSSVSSGSRTQSVLNNIAGLGIRQSPLWNRDLTEVSEDYVCEYFLPQLLEYFKVARIIVGHTPQEKRMVSLCGTRLILADSSISKYMRKRKWTEFDESPDVVEESDRFGRPIVGNPSVLIMKRGEDCVDSISNIRGSTPYGGKRRCHGPLLKTDDETKNPGGRIRYSTSLESMYALYYNEHSQGIERDAFFESGWDVISENPSKARSSSQPLISRLPTVVATTAADIHHGSSVSELFRSVQQSKPKSVKYSYEGTVQSFPYAIEQSLYVVLNRYQRPHSPAAVDMGLPTVIRVTSNARSIEVLTNVAGPTLEKEFLNIFPKLTYYRQILVILKNLEYRDLAVEHVVFDRQPLEILSLFTLDQFTKLVTLSDISILRPIEFFLNELSVDQGDDFSSLVTNHLESLKLFTVEKRLAAVMHDLELAYVTMRPELVEVFDIFRVAQFYWPQLRTDMLRFRMDSVETLDRNRIPVLKRENSMGSVASSGSNLAPTSQVMSESSINLFNLQWSDIRVGGIGKLWATVSSVSLEVMVISLAKITTRGTLVKSILSSDRVDQLKIALDKLLIGETSTSPFSLMRYGFDDFSYDTSDSEKKSELYILFDFVGVCASSVNSVDKRFQISDFDVVSAMYNSVKELHKAGVLLGFEPNIGGGLSISDFFYMDHSSGLPVAKILELSYLKLVSNLPEPAARKEDDSYDVVNSDELFEKELADIKTALRQVYPSVILDDDFDFEDFDERDEWTIPLSSFVALASSNDVTDVERSDSNGKDTHDSFPPTPSLDRSPSETSTLSSITMGSSFDDTESFESPILRKGRPVKGEYVVDNVNVEFTDVELNS